MLMGSADFLFTLVAYLNDSLLKYFSSTNFAAYTNA